MIGVPGPPRLCLNMIVKNEAANLPRCLGSVADHVSCWIIGDTGSTDGSQDLIRSFFAGRSIPGELHGLPFINFEHARNDALDRAYASPLEFDYLLLMDADMELMLEDSEFRRILEAPAYAVWQRSSVSYANLRLIRRDVRARYRGVTHEYLEVTSAIQRLSAIWFRDHESGSNRVDKLERDIRLLSQALQQEPQNARYWFYLAQSYRDAGRTTEAAQAFAKRVQMGGWDEEAWSARLQEARCRWKTGDGTGFVSQALAAFAQRPHRAEPLYDLARFYRESGMHAASVLFSELGLTLDRPRDDVLFIEDHVYDVGLQEEYSIAAGYARDPTRKDRGFAACNALALKRGIPDGPRARARANLHFYVMSAAARMPSFAARPIRCEAAGGRQAGPASVAGFRGEIVVVQSAAAVQAAEGGHAPPARCLLLRLSPQLETVSTHEVPPPVDSPTESLTGVREIDELRPFVWKGGLWLCATVRGPCLEGRGAQVIARVEAPVSGPCRLGDLRVIRPDGPRRGEAGWMPRADDDRLDFIERCDPTRIVDDRAQVVAESVPAVAADAFRVATQMVRLDGGWVALVHATGERDGRVFRYHRFVWFDATSTLRAVSRPFFLNGRGDERAGGLAVHPDGRHLLITFSADDGGSWIATVDGDEVRATLEDVDLLLSAATRAVATSSMASPTTPLLGRPPSGLEAGARDAAPRSRAPRILPAALERPFRAFRPAPARAGRVGRASARSAVSTWVPPTPAAGTELMVAGLRQRLGRELDRINLQVNCPGTDRTDTRPQVVWVHHDIDQEWVQWCDDETRVDTVDRFVFVSAWQRERYLERFALPPERCVVLRNATDVGAEGRRWKPGTVLRCAYVSAPFRGLSVLLDAWQLLAPAGAELHIWSSMRLYRGDDGPYRTLYERAQSLPGVIYRGIVPNVELRAELRKMHFLAYPSTFAETSCLAVIEAMAAGCRVIVPLLGALPETTSGYARAYASRREPAAHAEIFARTLASELTHPWGGAPGRSVAQQRHCSLIFDWRPRLEEWRDLITSVCLSSGQPPHGPRVSGLPRAGRASRPDPRDTAARVPSSHPPMTAPVRLATTSHGLRIGIECDDAEVLAEVRRRLPLAWEAEMLPALNRMYGLVRHPPGPDRMAGAGVLRVDGRTIRESSDAAQLLEALVADLELYVAEMAQGRTFIHAGVVGWQGSAIMLPGRSLSGKTRLVVALMGAGAEYYSDEYAVLDAEGRVHPYPRLLSIRSDDGRPRRRIAAEDLGGRRATTPARVGVVVLSSFAAGTPWQPRRLSDGEAILALLSHSVSVRRKPALVVETLARVVAGAPVWVGTRGESAEVAATVLSLLSSCHGG